MRMLRNLSIIPWVLVLAACAGAPAMPETTYYRMPAPIVAAPAQAPVELPIVVSPLGADGLYSDQALIYAMDAQAGQLRSYHYQLWIDPPTRLLQRRLVETLRRARLSRVVTDRLPTRMAVLAVSGRIVRLERIKTDSGWEVVAGLVLRAEPSEAGKPWVIGEYHDRVPAQGESVNDSVRAMAQALDQIAADFITDIEAAAKARAAGEDTIQVRELEHE